MWERMASNRGRRSLPGCRQSRVAVPVRPEANTTGLSSCSLVASSSSSSSRVSSTTSSGRASGRSILFTTMITGRDSSRAFFSTNRVWGMGPSKASTSSSTPPTIFSTRSTSPEKSAWPGVSTMLILTPL